MKDTYQEYLKERHEAHVARRGSLNELAFKTCERYDQWVLTLSGGALAISLTFLEKIAPEPAANTLFLLGLSWIGYILAILAGFCAIFFSRQSIYRQVDIDDAEYAHFRKTTSETKPEGDSLPEMKNSPSEYVNKLNKASLICLGLGTLFLCCFAFANISSAKDRKTIDLPPQINVNVNMSQPGTNTTITTTNKTKP